MARHPIWADEPLLKPEKEKEGEFPTESSKVAGLFYSNNIRFKGQSSRIKIVKVVSENIQLEQQLPHLKSCQILSPAPFKIITVTMATRAYPMRAKAANR